MKRKLIMYALLLCTMPAKPQALPPIMGWSSWNTYRVNINDTLIRRQADAMVATGLKDAGYAYINIDDGFFGWRDETGRIHTHPQRFPEGMEGVAGYIHSLGLKAGIYSDAGNNTCGSIWDNDVHGVGMGMYGFEHQDADLYFNEWGFDFIKIDYCGAGQELSLEEEKRYMEIRQAIDKVAGRHIAVNVCRWAFPGTWARKVGCSWRISPDIRPEWESVKSIIRKNLYLSAYARDGHYNDMDMLEIGRGLSRQEEEVHFGMWCLMSSPLLIGCDLSTIPASSLELLKNPELIALNQDPLGLQAYVVQHEGEGYVLAKDLIQERGKVRAVALYNPSDAPCDFSVPMEILELGGRISMRDLVKRQALPGLPATESILKRRLPPHSVLILRMEGEKRLEPVRYEAEWSYLPCYNDLGLRPKTILYAPAAKASGGMTVSWLGGRKENYAEWDKVYSGQGGNYEMAIRYLPAEHRKLVVEINGGKPVVLPSALGAGGQEFATFTLRITLKAGYNVIRMGAPYCWAPDIDCFTLKRLE